MRRTSTIGNNVSEYSNRKDVTAIESVRKESRTSNINPVGSTSTLRERSRAKSSASSQMNDDIAPVIQRAKIENKVFKGKSKREVTQVKSDIVNELHHPKMPSNH
jgi:hypothetical protein